jgi:hypothetical protein
VSERALAPDDHNGVSAPGESSYSNSSLAMGYGRTMASQDNNPGSRGLFAGVIPGGNPLGFAASNR